MLRNKITAAAVLTAILAFGSASPSYASTGPSLSGTAVCTSDGTYTVTWTGVTGGPIKQNYLGQPTAWTPSASFVSFRPWHVGDRKPVAFDQTVIPGSARSATVDATMTIYTAGQSVSVRGSVTLAGTCTPQITAKQIHKAFKQWRLHR